MTISLEIHHLHFRLLGPVSVNKINSKGEYHIHSHICNVINMLCDVIIQYGDEQNLVLKLPLTIIYSINIGNTMIQCNPSCNSVYVLR